MHLIYIDLMAAARDLITAARDMATARDLANARDMETSWLLLETHADLMAVSIGCCY